MLNNVDIAVLTKVNELAERFGLKPYEFVAVVKDIDSTVHEYALDFECGPNDNALRESRFEQMLTAIGVPDDAHRIRGNPATIINALDHALLKAPRPYGRSNC